MRVEKASLQQVKDRFAAHKRKAPGKDEPYGKMKTSRAMKKYFKLGTEELSSVIPTKSVNVLL